MLRSVHISNTLWLSYFTSIVHTAAHRNCQHFKWKMSEIIRFKLIGLKFIIIKLSEWTREINLGEIEWKSRKQDHVVVVQGQHFMTRLEQKCAPSEWRRVGRSADYSSEARSFDWMALVTCFLWPMQWLVVQRRMICCWNSRSPTATRNKPKCCPLCSSIIKMKPLMSHPPPSAPSLSAHSPNLKKQSK